MLELSPDETAANASAPWMPASSRTVLSKPVPVTVLPENVSGRRVNERG